MCSHLVDDEEKMGQPREGKQHIYYALVDKVKDKASKVELTSMMKQDGQTLQLNI